MHGASGKSLLASVTLGVACACAAGGCASSNPVGDARVLDGSPPGDVAQRYLDVPPLGSDVQMMDDIQLVDAVADGDDVIGMDVPPPTTMHIRFANLVPNPTGAIPPVDFCLQPSGMPGEPAIGPVLEMNGRAAGIDWNEVSAYFEVRAGTYDITVVPGTATSCTGAGIFPTVMGVATPPVSTWGTINLAGLPTPDAGAVGIRITPMRDRNPTTVGAMAMPALRLYDALPTPLRFDVGVVIPGPPDVFAEVYRNVGFGDVATGPTGVDAQGYYTTAAAPGGLSVGLRVTCNGAMPCTMPTLQRVDGVVTASGQLYSAWLTVVPNPAIPGQTSQGALMCVDTAPAANGLSACAIPGQ